VTTVTSPAPTPTRSPALLPPSSTTTQTEDPDGSYANAVDQVCEQCAPQLTELVTTGIDGGIAHEAEMKALVSQMLSNISAIPAPAGETSLVNDWITDWEQSWSAAMSENAKLFTSDIKTTDATAQQLGLGSP
jgi:hypothetical protein